MPCFKEEGRQAPAASWLPRELLPLTTSLFLPRTTMEMLAQARASGPASPV